MDTLPEQSSSLLSIKEAAEILPYSATYLYDLTRHNQIPHLRFRGKIRFKREDLALIMDKGLVKASPVIPLEGA